MIFPLFLFYTPSYGPNYGCPKCHGPYFLGKKTPPTAFQALLCVSLPTGPLGFLMMPWKLAKLGLLAVSPMTNTRI